MHGGSFTAQTLASSWLNRAGQAWRRFTCPCPAPWWLCGVQGSGRIKAERSTCGPWPRPAPAASVLADRHCWVSALGELVAHLMLIRAQALCLLQLRLCLQARSPPGDVLGLRQASVQCWVSKGILLSNYGHCSAPYWAQGSSSSRAIRADVLTSLLP